MGKILEPTPEMGEYKVEVRRESFYISGSTNTVWCKFPALGNPVVVNSYLRKKGISTVDEGNVLFDDSEEKPGDDWSFSLVARRHGIWLYETEPTGQGTAEILLEDIPKIRAALDQVEEYLKERGR